MKGFATFVLALAFKWIKIIYIFFHFMIPQRLDAEKGTMTCAEYMYLFTQISERERGV
jgi:hypothetical protein